VVPGLLLSEVEVEVDSSPPELLVPPLPVVLPVGAVGPG